MPASSPRSLRTQIALVAGALVVAVSMVLTFAMEEMLTERIRTNAGGSLQVVSSHAARLLAAGLHQRAQQITVLTQSETLWRDGLDSPEVKQMMARVQAINSFNRWIGVSDTKGVVQSATGDLLRSQDVSSRPWFAGGSKALYVGDVHPAKLLAALLPPSQDGQPLRFIDFAAPIRVDGAVVGVLGIHTGWEWAQDTIEQALPERTTHAGVELFIFDRSGELILAPDELLSAMRERKQRLPVVLDAIGTPAAATEAPARARVVRWSDGGDYLTSVTRLPARMPAANIGWYVIAREPSSAAYADVRSTTRNAMAIGALAALLASLIGFLGARRLSADLKQLVQATGEIEKHGRAARIPALDSSREVHALSTSLHSMTGRLLDMQDHMESLVRQRTVDLEAANRALDALAHSDGLTGLFNRRGFDAQFERALATARRGDRPLTLMMIDADHFKRINDTYGHGVGDEVLAMLGGKIKERLRDADIAGRYGGEEFIAVLPETTLAGARTLAQQLLISIAGQHHPVYGRITVSAGLATLASRSDRAADLIQRADAALYAAKEKGRNRVCQYPDDLRSPVEAPAAVTHPRE